MASDRQGLSCGDESADHNNAVCMDSGNCYYDGHDNWNYNSVLCIFYQCITAIMLSTVPVILLIWLLIYVRTEKGWRIGGWKIERVPNPYELTGPAELAGVVPMVAIPVRARLP